MKIKNIKLLRATVIIAAAGLLVFLTFYARTAAYIFNDYFREVRAKAYSHLSFTGDFLSRVRTVGILTKENISLKEENIRLLSEVANREELIKQNNFLREAMNLPVFAEKLIDAGVYDIQYTPKGHHLLINKGYSQGINDGDIVLSSSGILIGTIDESYSNHSRAIAVTDLNFKATISVLFKQTSGIARGAGADGVSIDFISQTDDIVEGDIIVTRGNDNFPPALVIGKVASVDIAGGSLFKNIVVNPIMKEINLDKVIVINN